MVGYALSLLGMAIFVPVAEANDMTTVRASGILTDGGLTYTPLNNQLMTHYEDINRLIYITDPSGYLDIFEVGGSNKELRTNSTGTGLVWANR
jgi:hypothetical protein